MTPPAPLLTLEANVADLLGCVVGLVGGTIEELDGVSRATSGTPSAMFNAVVGARVQGAQADAAIGGCVAHYAARDLPWFWWVGPGQGAIGEQLVAHGLFALDLDGAAMNLDLAQLPAGEAPPAGLAVERVEDAAGASVWSDLFVRSYDAPPPAASAWVETTERVGWQHVPWRLYGTLAEARRRGVGRALTIVVLGEARDAGYRRATLISTPDGYPVYERIGFVEEGRMSRYLWLPERLRPTVAGM